MLTYIIIPCVIQTELPIKTVIWTVALLFSTIFLQYLTAFSEKYSAISILAILRRGIKGVSVMLQFEIMKILDKISIIHSLQNKEKGGFFCTLRNFVMLSREQPFEQSFVVTTKFQWWEINLVLFNIWSFLTTFLSFIMKKKRGD